MLSSSKLYVLVVYAAALFSSTYAHTTDTSESHVHTQLRGEADNSPAAESGVDTPLSAAFEALNQGATTDGDSTEENEAEENVESRGDIEDLKQHRYKKNTITG
jgi:hypothetical protein